MKHVTLILTLLLCLPLGAQQKALLSLAERLAAFGKRIPQEKVYIHMDNTCYFQGDTIWFAAYTRQTTDDRPSLVSGVLYVELLNQDGYLVERKLIEMYRGRGSGFFALNNHIQYSGFYELRAYTRWQLNWGQFEHPHAWVTSQWFTSKDSEHDYYRDYEKLYSRVFPVYDRPQQAGDYTRDMTLRVMRRTFKDDPDAPKPTLTLFPEGGNLVAGVKNRVAFEAVMSDGQQLMGKLTPPPNPSRGRGVDSIPALSRGRGMFTVVPEKGMEQEVTFTTEDGQTVKAKLPKPEERGVALQVKQEGDSICIETRLAGVNADSLAMTIMHEGRVEEFHLLTEGSRFKVQGSKLPCGVHQVTVFDVAGRVWADRLFFVTKQEEMQPTLTVSGAKDEYQPYEQITLDVQGKAKDTPVSLAVRDGYQADALFDNANILTEMLLSSEIRGFVPDPGWFFEKNDEEHRQALDLLMMTQGWRRFNWRDMAVKGAWDLTEPGELVPIIAGTVKKNYDFIQEEARLNREATQAQNALDATETYAVQGKRPKDEELPKVSKEEENTRKRLEDEIKSRREVEMDYGNDLYLHAQYVYDNPKHRNLRLHVEQMKEYDTENVSFLDDETKGDSFRVEIPRFYGRSLLFLSVADTANWSEGKKKAYKWVYVPGGEYADESPLARFTIQKADRRAYVRWPYPRFVLPYTYYRNHIIESPQDSFLPPELLADSVHQMGEVTVEARRGRLRRFDDSQPAFIVDAYEAWNHVEDAGMILTGLDDAASIVHAYLGDYGVGELNTNDDRIHAQFGLSPTRRSLPQYIGIPIDSLYHPKYLKSIGEGFDWSPGERKEYFGDIGSDEDPRMRIDKYVIYTDYCPRLEGSRRYQGADRPETRVAIYPYYDTSIRAIYRDRRYMFDGFAYPAEFYSPDYSKQKPQEPTDYRRTLYWNPNLQLDAEGRAHVTLYNNSRTTQIEVEAAGITEDGGLLWK